MKISTFLMINYWHDLLLLKSSNRLSDGLHHPSLFGPIAASTDFYYIGICPQFNLQMSVLFVQMLDFKILSKIHKKCVLLFHSPPLSSQQDKQLHLQALHINPTCSPSLPEHLHKLLQAAHLPQNVPSLLDM